MYCYEFLLKDGRTVRFDKETPEEAIEAAINKWGDNLSSTECRIIEGGVVMADESEYTQKIKARNWMRTTLRYEYEHYDDCGEVNCTKLAEDCANELNIYVNEENYDIPEWVFDVAVDVSEWFNNKDEEE